MEWISPVKGYPGDEAFCLVADELTKRGYKANEIDLIMGENFIRVFKEVLKP